MLFRSLNPSIADRFWLMPLNQFDGRHFGFARQMQWRAGANYTEARDYDRAITRMVRFTRWLGMAIERMRIGLAKGAMQPRIIAERMLAQADNFAAANDSNVFLAPLKAMPAALSPAEHKRVESAYREAVEGTLLPAYRRLADFLKDEYLPAARSAPGLSAMEGGRAMYLYLVRSHTTLETTPEALHALGLSEIARIERTMEDVKARTGFSGSLSAFRQFLRSDPRFRFGGREPMRIAFESARDKVQINLEIGRAHV